MDLENTHWIAALIFGLAIGHTFLTSRFTQLAHSIRSTSWGKKCLRNGIHLLGEVELVFGLWAFVLIAALYLKSGGEQTIQYVAQLQFTEPLFVVVVMVVVATRPLIDATRNLLLWIASAFSSLTKFRYELSVYFCSLTLGPLLGSFVTEPAAMTVTALLLREKFFGSSNSQQFRYATLAVLFVNVSIGGVLTSFAAPPVLMVAQKWNWSGLTMLTLFGWKAAIAVVLNAFLVTVIFRKEIVLSSQDWMISGKSQGFFKHGLSAIHLLFLILIVINVHSAPVFVALFFLFLGFYGLTRAHQETLKIKEGLLVGFFLSGLVVLGGLQEWWLRPLVQSLKSVPLFLGSTILTAFMDNAALTYLGSQVSNIPNEFKYALVAGAISGGGLTVIANAPNPAGFSILQDCFGDKGIQPLQLLLAGAIPTLVAMICFWCL